MGFGFVLHALSFSAVVGLVDRGRPRVPAEWSCRGAPGRELAAMRKLRGEAGLLLT